MQKPIDLAGSEIKISDVSAIIIADDGRYVMQLRDDLPHIRVPDHWGLFGGGVEPGETLEEAFVREIKEELGFKVYKWDRFTEIIYSMHFTPYEVCRKVFFIMPVNSFDLSKMTLQEGAEIRLFDLPELLLQPKIVPSDIYGLLLYDRREHVLRSCANRD